MRPMQKDTRQELQHFGWLVGGAFVLLGGALAWWSAGERRWLGAGICAGVGAALIILGSAAPMTLRLVHRYWMKGALWMGMIMTPVIMTVFFFTILLPFTLIRLGDPLRKKLGAASYWEPHRNVEPSLERFQRPF